jgi:hypothetical protein
MFNLLDKEVFGKATTYTFEILNYDYDLVGKILIIISDERNDAGIVFNKEKVSPVDAVEYIETFRDLLENDLLPIDEEHKKIFITEIVYEESKYLF